MKINTYLYFDGDCEEAFDFYAKTLGGKVAALYRAGETPAAAMFPEGWANKVMHARLEVGDSVLMGSDAPPQHFTEPAGFRVCIEIDDAGEGERIFNALAEGGSAMMPYQETFFAHRFGQLTDRFGTRWMVNCEKAS